MAKRQKKPAPRRKKAVGPSKAQVKKFMKAYVDSKNTKE